MVKEKERLDIEATDLENDVGVEGLAGWLGSLEGAEDWAARNHPG